VSENVATSLWDAAERWPHQPALILATDGRTVTFDELRVQAGAVAAGLQAQGVEPGDRVLVMLKPGLEFFATMFGLSAAGATGVLVDPGMGYSSMFRCLESIKPKAIIAESAFHLLSWFSRTFDGGIFRVSRGWLPGCVSWHRFVEHQPIEAPHPCGPEQLAVLAFTSGSTGAPKPVVMDHGTLGAQIEAVREMSGIEPGQAQMAFIPLNALLGPGLGCTTVLPSVDSRRIDKLDARKTIGELNRYDVTHCLGSPFIWRRIAAVLEADEDVSLPLEHLLIGGAPPDRELVETLQRRCNARISIAYGATEAVPIATGSAEEFLANPSGCLVGKPVPQMEAIMIVEDDEPRQAKPEEVGQLWIRGPLVSPGYDGFASTEHRRHFDGKEWHPTGDCGFFTDAGRLVLVGRKAHCVQTSNGMLYPLVVEPIFEKHPGVSRAALLALDEDPPQRAALAVIPTGNHSPDELTSELLKLANDHALPAIDTISFRREFPMDVRHHSKILRHELARKA
jgi:olefin beta-lactone synthetase